MAGEAPRCRPIVPAMSPRHARAFAMHTRPSPPSIPRRLRQTDRRNRVSGVAWATSALHSERNRADVGPHPPGPGIFVAGRRRGDLLDSSLARTHAQSRADIESSRARVLYMAGYGRLRIFCCDSAAPRCAPVEIEAFPGRLRRRTDHSPIPRATTASSAFRPMSWQRPQPLRRTHSRRFPQARHFCHAPCFQKLNSASIPLRHFTKRPEPPNRSPSQHPPKFRNCLYG